MFFNELSLHSALLKAIQACGYEKPTPIQAAAIPAVLAEKDVIASAPTGTGKTAAFVLPALHRLTLTKPQKNPRVLILTPTRELALQIFQAITTYGKFINPKVARLVGGMSYFHQIKDLERPVDIVVATPGRLLDHLENDRVNLSQIDMLVLDEADRMVDMGFINDVKTIIKAVSKERQTLLFSATVSPEIIAITEKFLTDPVRIDLSAKETAPTQIKQELYLVDNRQHKDRLLKHFVENTQIYKAIIFSATKINADKLAKQLRADGLSAAALHGDLKQQVRNRTLDKLRRGTVQYLVATDVAARGIDVSDITHVFNYDLPMASEDYVHRIGRTGRAGKTGTAISFALASDAQQLRRMERHLGQRFEWITIPGLEPATQLAPPTSFKKPNNNKRRRFHKGPADGKSYQHNRGARKSRSSSPHY